MTISEKYKPLIAPTFLVIFYFVLLYFFLIFEQQHNLLIPLSKITAQNLGIKFSCDFVSSIAPIIILLIITRFKKRTLRDLGITRNCLPLVAGLLLLYLLLFLIHKDFSVRGTYSAFYYLIVVAFSEEFILRGYLFTRLEQKSGFWPAIVISGLIFGAAHSLFPTVLYHYNALEFSLSVFSNLIGQGILAGGIFALIYKKSKTLFTAVLVHAILDYSNLVFLQ